MADDGGQNYDMMTGTWTKRRNQLPDMKKGCNKHDIKGDNDTKTYCSFSRALLQETISLSRLSERLAARHMIYMCLK